MSFVSWLHQRLWDPRMTGFDLDGPERTRVHERILGEKSLLRSVYSGIYGLCRRLDDRYLTAEGRRVELGSGSSLFKRNYPDILSTDILAASRLDLAVDAQRLPFAAGSVRAFYAINTFHHFPSPNAFFRDLTRTLASGGGCVLVEPYYGPAATFLFKRMFESEGFDRGQVEWSPGATESQGPMTGANQALAFIIFERDRALFEERHPQLEIVCRRRIHNYLRYLFSGGLNFRQLAPDSAAPALELLERFLVPLSHLLALHHAIVLRKR